MKALVNGPIDNDEKVAFSNKHINQFKTEMKNNNSLFMTKMGKIDTLFRTKTVEKPYPLGPHVPV